MEKFEFKKITSIDNIVRLSDLMEQCFGMKVDLSYFKWKYFDNPAGEVVAYEALCEGKTVAFYGIIPEYYILNGRTEKIYQSMDTMTHPEFQRKGLFVSLAEKTYNEVIEREGKLMMIGFPGEQSYHGFVNKLGWKRIHECRYIFCHNLLFKTLHLFSIKKDITLVKYDCMSDELGSFLSSIHPHTKNSKLINKEIFEWKVFSNPRLKYKVICIKRNNQLIGICVYLVDYSHTCQILWIHFSDENDGLLYFSEVVKYIFNETKIKYIYSWETPQDISKEMFRKVGFIPNPFKKGPFHLKFSFITYEKNSGSNANLGVFEDYDFQPILLD